MAHDFEELILGPLTALYGRRRQWVGVFGAMPTTAGNYMPVCERLPYMDSQEIFVRQLDELIDSHAKDAGYLFTEVALQDRAQDMREMADERGELNTISSGDMAEWRAEQNTGDE